MYWKKLKKSNMPLAEKLLKKREKFCVSAISRLNTGTADHIWTVLKAGLSPKADSVNSASALLLYGKRLIFPVFDFSPAQLDTFRKDGLPLPFMFSMVLKRDHLHAAQGLADDMDLLEKALKRKHFVPASAYDYELLNFDCTDADQFSLKIPPGLLIRKAEMSDADALYPLQAGYEQEEVLPKGAAFNPALCRRVLESLIAGNMVMTAELEGKPAGKININAYSYSCFQIGGVYVLPEYRNRGIARAMTAALIREYAPVKNRFTLFVKKANIPARRAYDSLGFKKIDDYRITYY